MPIGPISRIYLAVDKETNRSRGFAFVNFRMRFNIGLQKF